MKLCLGTVQFGLDYGLRGKRKPPLEDAVAILRHAGDRGIDAIDTSALYGSAEEVVGAFLASSPVPREKLFLVSKFGTDSLAGLSEDACAERIAQCARDSLARMGIDCLDALICHVPTAVYDDRVMRAMSALKKAGLARHVGFSVYETAEAAEAIGSGAVDFLQIPFSVLDQRMDRAGILDRATQSGVILHSRSAYLQGAVLMDVDALTEHLAGLRPFVTRLDQMCQAAGITRRDLALAFVRSFPQISHVVFGVHDVLQLDETIDSFSAAVPDGVIQEARTAFSDIAPELVMPNKWMK